MKIGVLVVLAGLVSGSLFAQEYRGTFSGSVTDAQGAVVPKASVVATETRTGVKTTATSESTGEYTLPFLPPGEYEIAAEAPGFKRTLRQGLTLSAGEHPIVDFRLELGAVSESVTVTGETPLVTTSTASIGQSVTTHEVEDIPINGRAPIMLMTLAMGVIGGGFYRVPFVRSICLAPASPSGESAGPTNSRWMGRRTRKPRSAAHRPIAPRRMPCRRLV